MESALLFRSVYALGSLIATGAVVIEDQEIPVSSLAAGGLITNASES